MPSFLFISVCFGLNSDVRVLEGLEADKKKTNSHHASLVIVGSKSAGNVASTSLVR